MKIYSYVVARDFGFAPNPFYGFCTLATCKPVIRKMAKIGDWVVGTGSARNSRNKNFVFVMKVSEVLTFDQYWSDERFQRKKPNLFGSKKKAFGDNIYHRDTRGDWLQESSHHSHADGCPNQNNITNDTQENRVLIASDFTYWGATGPSIPTEFRQSGSEVRAVRGHRSNFDSAFIKKFVNWLEGVQEKGQVGKPSDWSLPAKTYKN